jgi:endoglucanase
MIRRLIAAGVIVGALSGCQSPVGEEGGTRAGERVVELRSAPRTSSAAPLTFLTARGRDIVDPSGNRVQLRGCNIGCWLLIEPWMLSVEGWEGCGSEKEMWDTVEARFGREAKLDLIRAYRDAFFTEADVKRIADLGMNCMRLPLWWRAIADPEYGGDWTYVDRCIAWGKKYGVYTILDLHGAPGSQNNNVAIIGEPASGEFWTSDEYKRRTIELWTQMAERYKDEPAVAGYDLLNEPMDAPFDDLMALYDDLYKAIRAIDGRHVIIMQDGFLGFHRFPQPASRGWSNVVYSFHYYPQNPEEGAIAASTILPRFNRAAVYYGVPVYVGEFNTVMLDRGGAGMFQRLAEVHDYYGWPWTFWAYKKLENNRDANWSIYGRTTNDLRPDFAGASREELAASFERLRTENLGVDNLLATALAEPMRWEPPAAPGDGSIPLVVRDAMVMPGPKGTMRSEWGLERPNVGFWLYGDTVAWRFSVPKDGVYQLRLAIASQLSDCPVQFWVDGVHAGKASQAGTGSWVDFQERDVALLDLKAGEHTLELNLGERGQGFNLRGGALVPASGEPMTFDEAQVWLRPANVGILPGTSPIRVEWLAEPPHFGFWTSGEKVRWTISLGKGGRFQAGVMYATPTKGTKLSLLVNGTPLLEKELPATGDWGKFSQVDLGRVDLPEGAHAVELVWETPESFGAGNLREVKLQRVAQTAAP